VNVRTSPRLATLYFSDESLGWAAGADGLVVRTDDGGLSWQRLTEGGRDDLANIFFIDNSHGWAVGERGKFSSPPTAVRVGPFVLQERP
jgi:photosystem II stability/assembly factor-like uncharacterized protein